MERVTPYRGLETEKKMARRVILSDDLTGEESEDVETVTYSLQNTFYEIDLSEASWKKLDSALARFIKVSREVTRAQAISRFAAAGDSENDKVRAWAKDNGFEVGDRGRLSDEIKAAYANFVQGEIDKSNNSPTGKVTESNDKSSNDETSSDDNSSDNGS